MFNFKYLAAIILCIVLPLFAQDTIKDPNPDRFASEISRFTDWDKQNAVPENGVLFVGSSSIRGWMTAELFPGLPVINRGFGGSHISDVNVFADKIVLPYRPAIIVFYAGDNDVAYGKSAERVFADYQQFIATVNESLPTTDVVYVPIKPSILRWEQWTEMARCNDMIREFSEKNKQLHYVDTATPMLGMNGTPEKRWFIEDGLHLSPEGYKMWSDLVKPILDELRNQ